MPNTTPSKKSRKAEGEIVWVIDGKTEYMAQLMEPMAVYEFENKDLPKVDQEVEVRWTHNLRIEWVNADTIRPVEMTSPSGRRRVSSRKNYAAVANPDTPSRTKKTATPKSKTVVAPPSTNKAAAAAPPSTNKKKKVTAASPTVSRKTEAAKAPTSSASTTSKTAKAPPSASKKIKALSGTAASPKPKMAATTKRKVEAMEKTVVAERATAVVEPPEKRRKTEGRGFFAAIKQGFQEVYKELLG